ncbi:MAG: Choline-sulfatase [Bryobacteraceae bacterium]|nr:Choline-sulfatase [Bryobacteraceae bacterium]
MNRRQFAAVGAAAALRVQAAENRRPNILLLFPDQHRHDWTGLDSSLDVRMPHLRALAARGARFTNAIVGSPLCAPSRACIAAGKEYARCGVPSNAHDYPLSQTTFYSLLRQAGYHTAACGKIDLHKKTLDWGLDGRRLLPEWGFSGGIDNAGKFDAIRSGALTPKDPYMAYLHKEGLAATHVADFKRRRLAPYRDTGPTPLPDPAYCDNWIAANALSLLRAAPEGKPWFLAVNFTGPHDPMDITRSMEGPCRHRDYPQPNRCNQFDAATHTAIRQNYTAMVENIDRRMGEILEAVHARGDLDNTIVFYSSDHGEMLGDHGRWGKTQPYQPSVGVPFTAAGPGIEPSRVITAPVTLVDLAATCLDYAGVATPRDMDSRSMRPLLEGSAKRSRQVVLSGLGGWRMAFDGHYKLIHGYHPGLKSRTEASAGTSPPLLFDLTAGPLENNNLAAKLPHHVRRLEQFLKDS